MQPPFLFFDNLAIYFQTSKNISALMLFSACPQGFKLNLKHKTLAVAPLLGKRRVIQRSLV